MIRRRACLHPGCPLTLNRDSGQRYCPSHASLAASRADANRRAAARRGDDEHRRAAKKIYDSDRWRKLRPIILARDPVCRACARAASSEVDHIKPLRTHPQLAFVESNLQGLCHPCHGRKTQSEQRGLPAAAADPAAAAGGGRGF